jgi:hypothetical protein
MTLSFIRDRKEFLSGAIFATIGLTAFVLAQDYDVGTLTQMGPGYFPACLGVGMLVCGVALIGRSMFAPLIEKVGDFALVDMLFVLGGVVAFALLIDRTGLLEAVAAVVLMGCYSRIKRRPIEVIVLCALLSAATIALFIYGLGIPIAAY